VPADQSSEDDSQSSSQSHGISRGADDNARPDETDADPVMPSHDSSLTTKI
jgi:hypothetical protein